MSSEPEPTHAEYASRKGEIVLRSHEYDGIREYDQVLPNWWLFLFYGSIAFFVGYWLLYYNFGLFHSDQETIGKQIAVIEETKARELQEMVSKLNDETLVSQWATDPSVVQAGRQIFLGNCIACHGQDLSGRIDIGNGQSVALPGLPLTDGQWKYGAKPMDLFKLINEGTPAGSAGHNGAKMEAWGQRLPPLDIARLTAFIIHENPKDFGN